LNADSLAPLLLAFGFLSALLARSESAKKWSWLVFSIGLVLFGLSVVGMAVEPLKEVPELKEWLTRFEVPLLGVMAGAAATIALQSSSAMMGLIIVLAGEGLISLPAGLALMLGAEIGTCADTIIASLGRSRAALRAGLFHLFFNVVSVAIGVVLLGVLARFATATATEVSQQVANAHVAFNVSGALIFLLVTPWIAKSLERLLPDKEPLNSPATQSA
ncbi:MAG TPA: Na/Pi symporter, partial [Steroidobacteraceae bacterium]|nr:Na/Pi symporter [Steroidobacteraceae bacterium]